MPRAPRAGPRGPGSARGRGRTKQPWFSESRQKETDHQCEQRRHRRQRPEFDPHQRVARERDEPDPHAHAPRGHHVPPTEPTDHGKRRHLAVFDRRGRVPSHYCDAARTRGFEISIEQDITQALTRLGGLNVMEVLVEAGPTLLNEFLARDLWDEHVIIRQRAGAPDQDVVETMTRTDVRSANYKRM